jgi:hypothetical protein
LGLGFKYKTKSTIIQGVIGSVLMIGLSAIGIFIGHPIKLGILGIVADLGFIGYMVHGADERDQAERQKYIAEQEERRKNLEARAAAGDEAAKRELIQLGTDITDSFYYFNYDFDPEAHNRLLNFIAIAMLEQGIIRSPFDTTQQERSQNGIQYCTLEGRTSAGDTLFMEYKIGNATPGRITYSLNVKELPDVALKIMTRIRHWMEEFLKTVPEWTPETDKARNNYQGSVNNASTAAAADAAPKTNSKDIHIYANSYGYGDVAFTINGNNIYKGSVGYGDVAYRIDGSNIYKGSGGYDVAYRIDGNNIYKGSGGYDVAFTIGV